MLTDQERRRLRELEAKPFGTLSPSENAELAYLRFKRDGGRAGFIDSDEDLPPDRPRPRRFIDSDEGLPDDRPMRRPGTGQKDPAPAGGAPKPRDKK